MKGKNLLCLAILASLMLGMLPLVRAHPTTFYFDPATIVGPPPSVGETFTVTVRVDMVSNLFLWVMDIAWDPAIFDLVTITEGNMVKADVGVTIFTWIEPITDGYLSQLTCGSLDPSKYASVPLPPDDLVRLTFLVEDYTYSSTQITIPFARYIDFFGNEHTPAVESFSFELLPPPPTPPTAAFTPPTSSVFYVDDVITFDASASKGGYDGDDPTVITEYRWDFDGDLAWDAYGKIVTWSYGTVGDKSVTLEVYAPGIPPEIDPRYVETDQETHVIHIIEKMLVGVDGYTDRNGIGPGMPSDAYGPQEEVILYAKVTYGGDPVVNKLVGFEVKDNEGNVVITRTAPTDMDGIATTSFRIPWTGMEAEQKFGTWTAFYSVDIVGTIYTDYCSFKFGYIVSILSVATADALGAPKSTFLKGEDLHVNLELKNISFNSKTVVITVTVYDDAGVPIGFAMIPGVTVPPGTSPFFDVGIIIPYWRFKGTGRVYVNIFNAMPQAGGVPYCPEKSTLFFLG